MAFSIVLSDETPIVGKLGERELTIGSIFGSGLAASNEIFASFHFPHVGELYQPWLGSLKGWAAGRFQVDQASSDTRMQYQSMYSDPNPTRARQEKERLLRENTLVVRRALALAIGETCEHWSDEPRDRGRKAGDARLTAGIGDRYIVEYLADDAAELGATIKGNVTALFADPFPTLPLSIEIEYL